MVALAAGLLVLLCNTLIVAAPPSPSLGSSAAAPAARRTLQASVGCDALCAAEGTCVHHATHHADGYTSGTCCAEANTPASASDCGAHSTGLERINVSRHVCRCTCQIGYSGPRCEIEEGFCDGLHRTVGVGCSLLGVLGIFGWVAGMLVFGEYPIMVWFESKEDDAVQDLSAYERAEGLVTQRAWHETTETGSIEQRLVSRIEKGLQKGISTPSLGDEEESDQVVSFDYTCVVYTATIEFAVGEQRFSLPGFEMARTTGAADELYMLGLGGNFPLGLGGLLHTDLDPRKVPQATGVDLTSQVPLVDQVTPEEVARLEQKWLPIGSAIEVCFVPDKVIGTAALQQNLDEKVKEIQAGRRKISEPRHVLGCVGLIGVWLVVNYLITVPVLGLPGAAVFWLFGTLPAAVKTYIQSAQHLIEAEKLTISVEFTDCECVELGKDGLPIVKNRRIGERTGRSVKTGDDRIEKRAEMKKRAEEANAVSMKSAIFSRKSSSFLD